MCDARSRVKTREATFYFLLLSCSGEVKVYNTIVTDAAQLLRGATQAFGATRERLLKENLGDFAPSDVVAPRSEAAGAILALPAGYVSR